MLHYQVHPSCKRAVYHALNVIRNIRLVYMQPFQQLCLEIRNHLFRIMQQNRQPQHFFRPCPAAAFRRESILPQYLGYLKLLYPEGAQRVARQSKDQRKSDAGTHASAHRE